MPSSTPPHPQTLEFALPEDIERLRAGKKHDHGLSEKLELMDDAVCSVNSIEVRGPSTKRQVAGRGGGRGLARSWSRQVMP
eukprot:365500-Chlamydomonas_euryale.AAC.4